MDVIYSVFNLVERLFGGSLVLTCLFFAFITYFSVIIIGTVINFIESGLVGLLATLFGVKAALFVANYVTFPGTIIHELSHALFGVISGAKIKEIRIFEPPSSGKLGHVKYVTRGGFMASMFQNSFISCAPVISGTGIIIVLLNVAWASLGLSTKAIFVYIGVSIFFHMSMSGADVKNYLKGFPFIILLLFCAAYITGIAVW